MGRRQTSVIESFGDPKKTPPKMVGGVDVSFPLAVPKANPNSQLCQSKLWQPVNGFISTDRKPALRLAFIFYILYVK